MELDYPGKLIPGYSNYSITEDAKIYSLKMRKYMKKQKTKSGYEEITLVSDNNEKKKHRVHRLVGITFFNLQKDKQVNHIKGKEKANNNIENLESTTCSGNVQHAYDTGLRKAKTQKVCQVNMKTNKIIATFDSILEAEEKTGINNVSIAGVCNGHHDTAGGYRWCHYEDRNKNLSRNFVRGKPIEKLDKTTYEVVEKYDTVKQAAKANKCLQSTIKKYCNSGEVYQNHKWRYGKKDKKILTAKQEEKNRLEEITKDWSVIPNFDNYKISEKGEIYNTVTRRMLNPFINGEHYHVNIKHTDDNKFHIHKVHVLLASTFIPNPDNLPFVLHKDLNGLNNDLSNLMWGTMVDCNKLKKFDYDRPVVQYDLNYNEIARYENMKVAEEKTGANKLCIKYACTGKYYTALGSYWDFEEIQFMEE